MHTSLNKLVVTPDGIMLDGLPLNKDVLHVLPSESLCYINRAKQLLVEIKREDWDNCTPHDTNHVPTLAKIKMLLALAMPQTHKYSLDQPRVPAGNSGGGQWTSGGDMNAAIQSLRNRAKSGSTHNCAAVVRAALNEGGFNVQAPNGGHGYAKNFGSSLEDAGFETVASSMHSGDQPATYPPARYAPQSGDVVVMDTYPTSTNQAGHMAMYDGTQWISDFKQNQFWPGQHYQDYGSSYVIYRYPLK